jgi:hypothetical protein
MVTAIAALGALVMTQRSLDATLQGQVSDRFARAVEQLGAKESVDVRVGAIYSLERLAKDSEPDRRVVMEVLSNFVRTRSPAVKQSDGSYLCPSKDKVGSDIEAAVIVIGRRERNSDDGWVDLGGTCLRIDGANGSDFQQTILYDADISGASLKQARFYGTSIERTRFDGAILYGAKFERVTGAGALFKGAQLWDAKFDDSMLDNSDFSGADLSRATFSNSSIKDIKMDGVKLEEIKFSNVRR